MRRHFRRLLALSTGIWLAAVANVWAKPPGLPTVPDTEFKVLSPLAQEFYAADESASAGVFVPSLKADLTPCQDWPCFISRQVDQIVDGALFYVRKARLARDVFEMAETHQRSGDWEEAKHWYAGVLDLYPLSDYAVLAKVRLERLAQLRIVAEAGEEQSEEPPVAGPERLPIMPREVTR